MISPNMVVDGLTWREVTGPGATYTKIQFLLQTITKICIHNTLVYVVVDSGQCNLLVDSLRYAPTKCTNLTAPS